MSAFLSWDFVIGAPVSPLGGFGFDVVTRENIEATSTKTDKPVEQGVKITDHIRRDLTNIVLEVFVSNSPITVTDPTNRTVPRGIIAALPLNLATYTPPASDFAAFQAQLAKIQAYASPSAFLDAIFAKRGPLPASVAQVLTFPAPFNAAEDTWRTLKALKDNAVPVRVVAPHWYEENMAIVGLSAPRTKDEGDGLAITITLGELRIVQTRLVAVPVPSEPRASSAASRGAQGGADEASKSAKARSGARALASAAGLLP